jgi:hypothetical protein
VIVAVDLPVSPNTSFSELPLSRLLPLKGCILRGGMIC